MTKFLPAFLLLLLLWAPLLLLFPGATKHVRVRALFSGGINSLISVLKRVEGCCKRSPSTSKCYQVMCLVDCSKEYGIQMEIPYLVSSVLQAQWSLKAACMILSCQEFRGWQDCFLFQLKINMTFIPFVSSLMFLI